MGTWARHRPVGFRYQQVNVQQGIPPRVPLDFPGKRQVAAAFSPYRHRHRGVASRSSQHLYQAWGLALQGP